MTTRIAVAVKPTTEGRHRLDGLITTREYAVDGHVHGYRAQQITDPAYHVLIPVCQESELYPDRHEREMISADGDMPLSYCDRCASCGVWAGRQYRGLPR